MVRHCLITPILVLAITMEVKTQFFDIFQRVPNSYQISRISNMYPNHYIIDMTESTRRPISKDDKLGDSQINRADKILNGQVSITTSTMKPIEVSNSKPNNEDVNNKSNDDKIQKVQDSQKSNTEIKDKIVGHGYNHRMKRPTNNNNESINRRTTSRHINSGIGSVNNIYQPSVMNINNYERRTTTVKYGNGNQFGINDNYNKRKTTTKKPNFGYPHDAIYDIKTTTTTTTRRYPNNQQQPFNIDFNQYTTQNPYWWPGVKPSVTTNIPPFTNKPINRPVTTRPSYHRPIDSDAVLFPEDPTERPEIVIGKDEDSMSDVEKRRYIEISERMCDKYKSLDTKQIEAIPLIPSPDPVRVNVTSCTPPSIPLVVGGQVVTINDYPHMALVGWMKIEGGYSWKCGGSLVSDQFILTAAHCTYVDRDDTIVSGPPTAVQLGSSYLDDPGALVMKITSIIRHPKYKSPVSYYDLAILKLEKRVTFSEVVRPVCLGSPPSPGKRVVATGWGKTETADQSQELRSVSVPVWSMNDCQMFIGNSKKIPNGPSPDSQMCAGERKGGKDTCQGDSGGPAQIQDGCIWRVVAVTSLGRGCGAPDTPGLYAVVHKAFIAAHVFEGQNLSNDNHKSDNYRPESNNKYDGNRRTDDINSGNTVYNNLNNNRPLNTDSNSNKQQNNYDNNRGTNINYDRNDQIYNNNYGNTDNNNNKRGTNNNYDTIGQTYNNNNRGTNSDQIYNNNNSNRGSNSNYDNSDQIYNNNNNNRGANSNYDNSDQIYNNKNNNRGTNSNYDNAGQNNYANTQYTNNLNPNLPNNNNIYWNSNSQRQPSW